MPHINTRSPLAKTTIRRGQELLTSIRSPYLTLCILPPNEGNPNGSWHIEGLCPITVTKRRATDRYNHDQVLTFEDNSVDRAALLRLIDHLKFRAVEDGYEGWSEKTVRALIERLNILACGDPGCPGCSSSHVNLTLTMDRLTRLCCTGCGKSFIRKPGEGWSLILDEPKKEGN